MQLTELTKAGVPPEEIELGVITPAQLQIGKLWEQNRISVAQEHLATAISQLMLANLYPYLPRTRELGMSLVMACVEGEQHEVGARIAADFLEMAGFNVLFLGANVPTRSLVQIAIKERPAAVCLSAAMSFHLPALQDAVAQLRVRLPGLPIVVGGNAFSWSEELRQTLDGAHFASDPREMVERLKKLLHV